MNIKTDTETAIEIEGDVESFEVESRIKGMTLIKVDVVEKRIYEIDVNRLDLDEICEILDCDSIEALSLDDSGNTIYVDGEGWLHEDVSGGFQIKGEYVAADGLVVSTDESGADLEPSITIDALTKMVRFLTDDEVQRVRKFYSE